MTFKDEVTELQGRLAKAESERDTWRTSGMQENYLAAYSRVDALERQLERLRQEGLRARSRAPAEVCALLRSEPRADAAPMPPARPVEEPDESQRRLMAESATLKR